MIRAWAAGRTRVPWPAAVACQLPGQPGPGTYTMVTMTLSQLAPVPSADALIAQHAEAKFFST
jgi:hypothetical protein